MNMKLKGISYEIITGKWKMEYEVEHPLEDAYKPVKTSCNKNPAPPCPAEMREKKR